MRVHFTGCGWGMGVQVIVSASLSLGVQVVTGGAGQYEDAGFEDADVQFAAGGKLDLGVQVIKSYKGAGWFKGLKLS